MSKQHNSIFNQERLEVSQRIKEGKTMFYSCKKQAVQFASTIRSYVYEVFDQNGSAIGYCVPK